ncbi:small GTP-binding protein domain-containing protein [Kandleria vitulina]|uniref:Small GTP-binding protein domain-containing protein n=1 Tax=Kandleria vitulina TaxID=1630 RepID=A0A1H2PWW6_9FIRM|nr:dynamin family protein [Kandleria vitulina]SDV99360.1 small GTP-binding protein domain-containing protein [Kandleria vitulina]
MKPEMLQVQQYLNVHPILEKNATVKEKYVSLISHFVSEHKNKDLWCKQALRLYCDRIIGDGFEIKKENIKDLSLFKQFKFFKYRYYLLTDCLFIASYDNQKKGQKVLESIINFYGERYRKKMECAFNAFYSVNDDLFTKTFPELKAIYSIIWNNRLFIGSPLKKIMITANMSAGKSTLINALAGKKVNKTQNDTCTAKLHYLYNKAGEDNYSCEYDHDLELDASLDILMTDNDENDSTDIAVGTRFRSVMEIDKHVCFVDTPGVNSSMDKTHREMSNEAIKSADCDLLLYLFNGENIGSDDDIRHLKFVKDNYDGNIIFLVNRLDHYKKDVDSVSDTLTKVINDLKKIGFLNPTVYPISAYAGYLGKMALYGERLSEDEEDDFDYVKRKLSRDEFSYEKHYPINVNLECKDKDIGELLLHSGILSLEKILYQ